MRHLRILTDWLRNYGAENITINKGGKHPRLVFNFNGHPRGYVVSGTPTNVDHTIYNAQADIRKLLGPPITPQPKLKRNLEEMTMSINSISQQPFNPPRVLPIQIEEPSILVSKGTLAHYKATHQIQLRFPLEVRKLLNSDRLTTTFDGTDTFDMTADPNGNVVCNQGSGYGGQYSTNGRKFPELGYFGATPVEIVVSKGSMLVRALTPLPIIKKTTLMERLEKETATLLESNNNPSSSLPTVAKTISCRTGLSRANDGNVRLRFMFDNKDVALYVGHKYIAHRAGPNYYHLIPTSKKHSASLRRVTSATTEITFEGVVSNASALFGATPSEAQIDAKGHIHIRVPTEKHTLAKRPTSPTQPLKPPQATTLPATHVSPTTFAPATPSKWEEVTLVGGTITSNLRRILSEIRNIEHNTAYRLVKVKDKTTNQERWSFRAPSID